MAEHYCVVGQICPPGLLKESMQFYQGRLNVVTFQNQDETFLSSTALSDKTVCLEHIKPSKDDWSLRLPVNAGRTCWLQFLTPTSTMLHNFACTILPAQFCLLDAAIFCPLLNFKLFKAISRPWFFLFPPLAASPCHLWKRLRNSASTSTTITFGSMHLHNQIWAWLHKIFNKT